MPKILNNVCRYSALSLEGDLPLSRHGPCTVAPFQGKEAGEGVAVTFTENLTNTARL